MGKAYIGISDWQAMKGRMFALAHRLDAGERLPAGDYHLGFPDAAALLAELPPRRLDTLRALKAGGVMSIYALAKDMGRNYSNVHTDVRKLIEHGLIEKDDAGRVFVPWEDVVVRIDASLLRAA